MTDAATNTGQLCILGCQSFQLEVAAAIRAEGWSDVVAAAFPTRCAHPPLTWDVLRSLLPSGCTHVLLVGGVCLKALGQPPAGFPPTRIIPLEQCFYLVAGAQMVDEALQRGAYLMTPSWLAHWPAHLQALGFARDQTDDFLHDVASELLLLDTGVEPPSQAHLAELGRAVTLPVRRVSMGLDFVRLQLERWVLEWRLQTAIDAKRAQNRSHGAELADLAAAMDLFTRIAKSQAEDQVIAGIEELFCMLFAPAQFHYLRMEQGLATPMRPIPAQWLAAMQGLQQERQLTPDEAGFLLRLGRGDAVLGVVAVIGVAFPQYLQRYLNMALAMTGVCALALENARSRRRLLEADKMAALAVLVVGVAHEISTPLGVGLTAVSAMQQQARALAQRFQTHSMARSDLEQYLHNADSGSALVLANLERIGQLIEAFRNVAVNQQAAPAKQVFRLRECLDHVLASFGDRFPSDRIAVHIDCDPALEVAGTPSDWGSIFINLVSNSLSHGFAGRDHGVITFQMARQGSHLRLDYHDDGVGMAPSARARVFDPFYTTDMQRGTGLGMYLVYNLVTQRMGAASSARARWDRAYTFRWRFPYEPA